MPGANLFAAARRGPQGFQVDVRLGMADALDEPDALQHAGQARLGCSACNSASKSHWPLVVQRLHARLAEQAGGDAPGLVALDGEIPRLQGWRRHGGAQAHGVADDDAVVFELAQPVGDAPRDTPSRAARVATLSRALWRSMAIRRWSMASRLLIVSIYLVQIVRRLHLW